VLRLRIIVLIGAALAALAPMGIVSPSEGKPGAEHSGPCPVHRVEITNVRGPMRMYNGYGHEFTVEIDFRGSPEEWKDCTLEWWEKVSFRGSGWYSDAVFAHPEVREDTWQDHRRINPRSRTWRGWERRVAGGAHTIRIVDRPAIPLGNLRIRPGVGREYANLSRRLMIEVRVRCNRPGCREVRSAYLLQTLSEREGRPGGSVIAYGSSRLR
jgi:hypothetical protein